MAALKRDFAGRTQALEPTAEIQGLYLGSQFIKRKGEQCHHLLHHKTLTLMPKGCQKGDNIDAKTHPKSMPKYVSNKILDIMKNYVLLMC